jgi:hypothetical protein
MQIALLIFKLIPTILGLVKLAEALFAEKPKSGEEKKAYVMSTVELLSAGASEVFTGGAADTWARIREPISMITDAAAQIAFPNKVELPAPDAG